MFCLDINFTQYSHLLQRYTVIYTHFTMLLCLLTEVSSTAVCLKNLITVGENSWRPSTIQNYNKKIYFYNIYHIVSSLRKNVYKDTKTVWLRWGWRYWIFSLPSHRFNNNFSRQHDVFDFGPVFTIQTILNFQNRHFKLQTYVYRFYFIIFTRSRCTEMYDNLFYSFYRGLVRVHCVHKLINLNYLIYVKTLQNNVFNYTLIVNRVFIRSFSVLVSA